MKKTCKINFVKNILDGSLSKNILLFALPLAFTGILQQLFNAADIAVVGQFTGNWALSVWQQLAPVLR